MAVVPPRRHIQEVPSGSRGKSGDLGREGKLLRFRSVPRTTAPASGWTLPSSRQVSLEGDWHVAGGPSSPAGRRTGFPGGPNPVTRGSLVSRRWPTAHGGLRLVRGPSLAPSVLDDPGKRIRQARSDEALGPGPSFSSSRQGVKRRRTRRGNGAPGVRERLLRSQRRSPVRQGAVSRPSSASAAPTRAPVGRGICTGPFAKTKKTTVARSRRAARSRSPAPDLGRASAACPAQGGPEARRNRSTRGGMAASAPSPQPAVPRRGAPAGLGPAPCRRDLLVGVGFSSLAAAIGRRAWASTRPALQVRDPPGERCFVVFLSRRSLTSPRP